MIDQNSTAWQQVYQKAQQIVLMRLINTDTSHPVVSVMIDEGAMLVAQELIQNPSRFEPRFLVGDSKSEAIRRLGSLEEAARNAKLPPLPQILHELQKVINDPSTSAADVAQVISKDPKLTTTLLRIVNSPLFNLVSQIETVSRAVAVLGTMQLSTLASGTLLLNMFRLPDPYGIIDLEAFWKHSIAVGTYAYSIAAKLNLVEPERFFVGGLLHDVGWIALASCFPEEIATTMVRAEELKIDLATSEKKILGLDHAVFGAYLLRQWNFPLPIITGLAFHHDPERGAKYAEPKVLHAADFIANSMGLTFAGLCPVQPLHKETWDQLGLTGEDVRNMIRKSNSEIQSTFSILVRN
jgi:putative nucleotidyltransferase with HDIG domain